MPVDADTINRIVVGRRGLTRSDVKTWQHEDLWTTRIEVSSSTKINRSPSFAACAGFSVRLILCRRANNCVSLSAQAARSEGRSDPAEDHARVSTVAYTVTPRTLLPISVVDSTSFRLKTNSPIILCDNAKRLNTLISTFGPTGSPFLRIVHRRWPGSRSSSCVLYIRTVFTSFWPQQQYRCNIHAESWSSAQSLSL